MNIDDYERGENKKIVQTGKKYGPKDIAKDDVHLKRLTDKLNFKDTENLSLYTSKEFGEKTGVVD